MKLMRVRSPEEVLNLIDEHFKPLEPEELPLAELGGRCLAEDLIATEDIPAFNRSTVDGYALAASNTFGSGEGSPALLECIGEVLMGHEAPSIDDGQCCLVHTGGMLPQGADAVLMIEDTEVSGPVIQGFRQVAPGENVIHRGEDLNKGKLALPAGKKIRAPEIGLLASLGVTAARAHGKPRIGFFSSGDELVDCHSKNIRIGKIRDSNAPALQYLAAQLGAIVEYGGILPDQFEIFLERSAAMLSRVDFLLFSGGSSVGTRDFTARTMDELGKPGLLVEGIAIQPGKPTLLANCAGKPVLGLPGHPVSALNIFAIFGRAIINRLSGCRHSPFNPTVRASLGRNIASRCGRVEYVRVRLKQENGILRAYPVFGRSGMLRTMAEADGLLTIAAEVEGLTEGSPVEITLWE